MADNTLYLLATAMPFLVCLFWSVALVLEMSNGRGYGLQGRVFLSFVVVSTMLYACHFLHFSTNNPSVLEAADCLWVFCTLAVYPLFGLWIERLTTVSRPDRKRLVFLAPAVVCGAVAVFRSLQGMDKGYLMLWVKILFAAEVIVTLVYGLVKLRGFRKTIANYYADTEGKELRSVGIMLVLLLVTSFFSFIASLIGRDAFYGSILLLIPSVIFSVLLYSICYIGHLPIFDSSSLKREILYEEAEADDSLSQPGMDLLMKKIVAAMENDRLYLRHGLKITDLAMSVGSNRTYVSNCINKNIGKTFSDFVSYYRVKSAIALMEDDSEPCNVEAAGWKSGFSSRSQFWRSFKKETGMSPSEWLVK